MQEKSITTQYHIEIHKLMFYKTETWNAMKLQRVKIVLMQSMFQIERPGETSCSCVSILPRRSKCRQSNQRSILHARRWNSQVGIEKYPKGSETLQKHEKQEITWIPQRNTITERSWSATSRTSGTNCACTNKDTPQSDMEVFLNESRFYVASSAERAYYRDRATLRRRRQRHGNA